MGTPVCERNQGADLGLSSRQKDVLILVGQGQANKEIARTLGLCRNTVKRHLLLGYRKLGATDKTQAVMLALRQGEIHLDDMIIVIRGVTTAEQKSQLSGMIARANENGRRFTVRALADVNSQKPTGTHVVFSGLTEM
ncbi:MAG: LuxR C-terminal-related transcriptional regulator [Patescibacteria group bacterium]